MAELPFEIVYQDEHLIEIIIRATNGRFSCATTIYSAASGKELIDFGKQLQGFPQILGMSKKKRLVKAPQGSGSPKTDGQPLTAYAGLKFYCVDKSGYCGIQVSLQEEKMSERVETIGKAAFEINFEPAQIDKFSKELIALVIPKKASQHFMTLKTHPISDFRYKND